MENIHHPIPQRYDENFFDACQKNLDFFSNTMLFFFLFIMLGLSLGDSPSMKFVDPTPRATYPTGQSLIFRLYLKNVAENAEILVRVNGVPIGMAYRVGDFAEGTVFPQRLEIGPMRIEAVLQDNNNNDNNGENLVEEITVNIAPSEKDSSDHLHDSVEFEQFHSSFPVCPLFPRLNETCNLEPLSVKVFQLPSSRQIFDDFSKKLTYEKADRGFACKALIQAQFSDLGSDSRLEVHFRDQIVHLENAENGGFARIPLPPISAGRFSVLVLLVEGEEEVGGEEMEIECFGPLEMSKFDSKIALDKDAPFYDLTDRREFVESELSLHPKESSAFCNLFIGWMIYRQQQQEEFNDGDWWEVQSRVDILLNGSLIQTFPNSLALGHSAIIDKMTAGSHNLTISFCGNEGVGEDDRCQHYVQVDCSFPRTSNLWAQFEDDGVFVTKEEADGHCDAPLQFRSRNDSLVGSAHLRCSDGQELSLFDVSHGRFTPRVPPGRYSCEVSIEAPGGWKITAEEHVSLEFDCISRVSMEEAREETYDVIMNNWPHSTPEEVISVVNSNDWIVFLRAATPGNSSGTIFLRRVTCPPPHYRFGKEKNFRDSLIASKGQDLFMARIAGKEISTPLFRFLGNCLYAADFEIWTEGAYDLSITHVLTDYLAFDDAERERPCILQKELHNNPIVPHFPIIVSSLHEVIDDKPSSSAAVCRSGSERGRWTANGDLPPLLLKFRMLQEYKKSCGSEWRKELGELTSLIQETSLLEWKPLRCSFPPLPTPKETLSLLANRKILCSGCSHIRTFCNELLLFLGWPVERERSLPGHLTSFQSNVFEGVQIDYVENRFGGHVPSNISEYDVVLLNFGHWPFAVGHWPVATYESQLRWAASSHQSANVKKLFWMTSNPMPNLAGQWRNSGRVAMMNDIADEIMKQYGVEIVDSFQVIYPFAHLSRDCAHYHHPTPQADALMQIVVNRMLQHLGEQ